MSRFKAIVPLVNYPFEHVPNIFAASTDDPQSLITTLGYIDDLAYPPNITTPEFVDPPIPLLRTSDILYVISSANTIKLFGVYFVVQVGQSFQLVLTPSGGNVQPHSIALDSLAGLITTANQMIYTTAPNTYATSPITALALMLLSNSTTEQMRITLGIIPLTPSDPLKTFISSVDSPVVVGQLARFVDVNGTIQSSGILVTDILLRANNLNDLANVVTARLNLGLGSAALQDITFFLQSANNLSDLMNIVTARTNLGLGSAATQDNSFFLQVLNNLSDLNNSATARNNLGLGSAAIKTASDASKPNLASINGSTIINNIAIFSDINGTIVDSGTTITGFQPLSPALSSIASLVTSADQMLYTTASNTYATTSLTTFSRGLLALNSAATWRTGLGLGTAATQNSTFFLQVANNLSDLASISTARTNLGLGTAALQNTAFFLQSANNLSDLVSAATARTNLGLGTAAVQNVAFFLQSANNLSDVASAATSRTNLGLGTAATKAASNNALTGVASTSGAFVVNNIVVAADTSGSIKDGGAAISGFVLSTRTLTAAGLVTGGGDLSADRSFTVTAANQTTQEAATSNAVAVTPGTQLYHPSSIKASGTLHQAAAPSWLQQYNFTTIVRNSAGSYTVTMAVTFSSVNYQVVACPQDGSQVVWAVDQKTTTSFRIRQWTLLGIVLADVDMGITVTGDLS